MASWPVTFCNQSQCMMQKSERIWLDKESNWPRSHVPRASWNCLLVKLGKFRIALILPTTNVFGRASLCLSVWAITFEPIHIETLFLAWNYIITISRFYFQYEYQGQWVMVKVMCTKWLFTYFILLFLCMWLQVINKVKVTHQGQGHTSRSNHSHFKGEILLCRWLTFE